MFGLSLDANARFGYDELLPLIPLFEMYDDIRRIYEDK